MFRYVPTGPESVPFGDTAIAATAGLRPFGKMERMSSKPRSLLLDMFGEYLRYLGRDVRLTQVTALLGEFGVAPATVRVTMSRLRNEGWFTSTRAGRETIYTLTDHMRQVLVEGRERIFAPSARDWSRNWTMVIYQMSESERLERNQLRKTLAWHGFGPLTTSTWLAPGDRRSEAREFVDELAGEQADFLTCQSEGLDHDRHIAARCWDLGSLANDYSEFNATHAPLLERAVDLVGADALLARTELISTFRHFPFRDPRLPAELRPSPWPGDEAHSLFRAGCDILGPEARAHVAAVVGADVPAPD